MKSTAIEENERFEVQLISRKKMFKLQLMNPNVLQLELIARNVFTHFFFFQFFPILYFKSN